MKKNFQKIFFILTILSFSYLYSMEHQEIFSLVAQKFDAAMPGLQKTINSKNSGAKFELESALFAEKLGEQVEGFGLTIDVYNPGNKKIFVPIGDKKFKVKTTDYDVVTKNYVFECKDIKNLEKHAKIRQFLKERNMLLFFKNVYEEFKRKTMSVFLSFSKNKKRSILTINSECTGYQNISLMCSWIQSRKIYECAAQWGRIIKILANRSLVVMFKNVVPYQLACRLEEENLVYRENVHYENMNYMPSSSLKKVIDSFEKLVIC